MSLTSAESLPYGRVAPRSLLYPMLKKLGSLWLTVFLLVLLIGILLWGTVVEKYYGATAAKFGVYGAWWFNCLGLALGANSAASLALRWPWRRQQLGFILPHLGLIVLLVGCFVSRRYGIEATVSIIEGQSSNRAYQGARQHVELDGGQRFKLQVAAFDPTAKDGGTIEVPFTSGPFSWDDYKNGSLTAIPWSLAYRDRGLLYDRNGIRLEVFDYLCNSEAIDSPKALPFQKEPSFRIRQAKVRLTVDGQSDEFWIPCISYDPEELMRPHKLAPEEIQKLLTLNEPPERYQHTVRGEGRSVVMTFEPESFELGFAVHLNKAWQKLDPGSPGTTRKSFYASEIDLLPNVADSNGSRTTAGSREPMFKNLLVTLNAPLDFADPRSGKSFRMFQSNMSRAYEPQTLGIDLGEPVYISGLSLNDDPGRGLTYAGCLMIVAGIFAAYFIRFVAPRRNS